MKRPNLNQHVSIATLVGLGFASIDRAAYADKLDRIERGRTGKPRMSAKDRAKRKAAKSARKKNRR